MTGLYENSRPIDFMHARGVQIPKGEVNVVVGTTETLITRPGNERKLVLDVSGDASAVFNVIPGDYTERAYADTDITIDPTNQITIPSHGYAAGDGPYRLHSADAATYVGGGGFVAFADANPDTIKRVTGSTNWTVDGFVDDMVIEVLNNLNIGIYTIDTVTTATNPDDLITLIASNSVILETLATYQIVGYGTLPDPLSRNTDYYIGVVDDGTITLHLTEADAKADANAVVIADKGSETSYTIGGMGNNRLGLGAYEKSDIDYSGYNSVPLGQGQHVVSAPAKLTVLGSATAGTPSLTYWWLP